MATKESDYYITGALDAGNWDWGDVWIDPVPDTVTSVNVTGLDLQGSGTGPEGIHILCSAHSAFPGDVVYEVSAADPTPTGFTVYFYRTTGADTQIFWMAIRNP